jgi:predicted sulfurtransferase
MANMIYTSKKGKIIVFDDYADNTEEYNSYWVEMCPHCHNKYKGILKNKTDDGGTACGTCSVKGCENEANYYVDFDKSEVTFAD